MTDKIKCEVCNELVHHIAHHLGAAHPDISLDDYRANFPDAPLMSATMREKIEERQRQKIEQMAMMGVGATVTTLALPEHKAPMADVYGLGQHPAALNHRGEQIQVTVLSKHQHSDMVPERDPGYVFDVEMLKTILFGLELNIPGYLWGWHGTGKTTVVEQTCAYINRPVYRIQHTLNMVESDVVGDWRAKDGNTYFDLGPLPLAMLNGWVFLADEYDRAPPGVVSLYQAVLEGKPLVIKEAPPEHRVIRPHKNFRFVATGNTAGTGDSTGLYSGTLIQDAASYSRFGITLKVSYMDPEAERALLIAKLGLREGDAKNIVEWAGKIRESFEAGKIGATVGPRELLYAGKIGAAFMDFRKGLCLAIINRMSEVDADIAGSLAQRIFG